MNKQAEEQLKFFGMYFLFVEQNTMFLSAFDDQNMPGLVDNNIVPYVGDRNYRDFLRKHASIKNPLLQMNKKVSYYKKHLVPNEPYSYPLSTKEAQEHSPDLLLDIMTLEMQYFLPLIMTISINKAYSDFGAELFPFYMLHLDEWNRDKQVIAFQYGAERYDEYARMFNQIQDRDDAYDFGRVATNNIFNTEDPSAILYMTTRVFSVIDSYAEAFKKL